MTATRPGPAGNTFDGRPIHAVSTPSVRRPRSTDARLTNERTSRTAPTSSVQARATSETSSVACHRPRRARLGARALRPARVRTEASGRVPIQRRRRPREPASPPNPAETRHHQRAPIEVERVSACAAETPPAERHARATPAPRREPRPGRRRPRRGSPARTRPAEAAGLETRRGRHTCETLAAAQSAAPAAGCTRCAHNTRNTSATPPARSGIARWS